MTPRAATVVIANDHDALPHVTRFIDRTCRDWSLGRDTAARLCLVLEELVTNTLAYAYADGDHHDIVIRLELDRAELTVVYEDDGLPFNPLTVADPDFETPVEQWPIGRLGIHLVRRLVDRTSYERARSRNRITLSKSLRGRVESNIRSD